MREKPKDENWWKLLYLFQPLLLAAPRAPSDEAIAAIVQRCNNFRENTAAAWTRLLQDWKAATTATGVSQRTQEDMKEDFYAIAARVHQLEARGEESKAFQTLTETSAPFLVENDDEVEAISQLYPKQIPGPVLEQEPAGGLTPPEEDGDWGGKVTEAANNLRRGRAAGSAGTRAELFKALLRHKDGGADAPTPTSQRAMQTIAHLLATGAAPKGMYPFFAAGRIVPVAKANGGVRPIVLQPLWYKLTASTVLKEVKGALEDALGPYQHGVGMPGGAQIMAHKVRRLLEQEDHVLMQLDLKNGFGRVNRAHLFKELDKAGDAIKPLAKFARLAYGQTLRLAGTYNAGERHGQPFTVDMEHGVVQGDPTAPALFAFAIKGALECARLAGNKQGKGAVYAYIDDVCIVGPPAYVAAAYQAFKKALGGTGGKLNEAKTVIYPDTDAAQELAQELHAGAAKSTTELLGMHLSDVDTVRQALQARIEGDLGHAAKRLKQLAELDSQVALRLFTRCFVQKASHILRVQTPTEVAVFTTQFDKLLRDVLRALVMRDGKANLTKAQWLQATLPLSMSGLGVTTTQGTAPQAWLAAVAQAWPSMSRDPAFEGLMDTTHTGHYTALARKAATMAHKDTGEKVTLSQAVKEGAKGLQKRLSHAGAKVRLKRLKDGFADHPDHNNRKRNLNTCHRHRIASAATTSACLPYTALPSRDLSIPAEEFAVMLQQRLGVLAVNAGARPVRCLCGTVMSSGTSDLHLTKCSRGGSQVIPHNVMRDQLAEMATRAHMQAEREPSLIGFKGAKGKAIRADLRMVIEGQMRYFDATIVSMYRDDITGKKTALDRGVEAKQKKYQQVNAKNGHMKVQPLVMDAVGATNRVLERTADRIGHWLEAYLPMGTLNWAINTGPRYVRARLVIKVLRARARCLLRMRAVASPMGH